MHRIYLDTNVYCRPFDNQSQKRIAEETKAFVAILESGFEIVGSDVLEDEVKEIESRDMRIDVKGFLSVCKELIPLTDKVVEDAKKIMKKCDVEGMITCDDFLIKKAECVKDVKIVNPVTFAEEFIWLK